MSFMIDGVVVENLTETIDSTSSSTKYTFFNSSKVSISGVSDVATAPSGYYWTDDVNSSGRILFGGSATTMSRKGCRPQWSLKHTLGKGEYYISRSDTYDTCYVASKSGGSIVSGKIMDIQPYYLSTNAPDCYVFVTLQGGGGDGADSNGAIGGYSGGGGGGGGFGTACTLGNTSLYALDDCYISYTYWKCLIARQGENASENLGGAAGVSEVLNSTSSNVFQVLSYKHGAKGGDSGASGSSVTASSVYHSPETNLSMTAKSGGSYGSGNGGGGGASQSGAGGAGGGGNGTAGGIGAGGGGASWYLFKDQIGGDGGDPEIKIYY